MRSPLVVEPRPHAFACFIEALDRREDVQCEHLSGIDDGSSVDNDSVDIVAGGRQDQEFEGNEKGAAFGAQFHTIE